MRRRVVEAEHRVPTRMFLTIREDLALGIGERALDGGTSDADVVTFPSIAFNGIGDEAHETFVLADVMMVAWPTCPSVRTP